MVRIRFAAREVEVNLSVFGRSRRRPAVGAIWPMERRHSRILLNLNTIVYFTYQTQGLCAVHMWHRNIEKDRLWLMLYGA